MQSNPAEGPLHVLSIFDPSAARAVETAAMAFFRSQGKGPDLERLRTRFREARHPFEGLDVSFVSPGATNETLEATVLVLLGLWSHTRFEALGNRSPAEVVAGGGFPLSGPAAPTASFAARILGPEDEGNERSISSSTSDVLLDHALEWIDTSPSCLGGRTPFQCVRAATIPAIPPLGDHESDLPVHSLGDDALALRDPSSDVWRSAARRLVHSTDSRAPQILEEVLPRLDPYDDEELYVSILSHWEARSHASPAREVHRTLSAWSHFGEVQTAAARYFLSVDECGLFVRTLQKMRPVGAAITAEELALRLGDKEKTILVEKLRKGARDPHDLALLLPAWIRLGNPEDIANFTRRLLSRSDTDNMGMWLTLPPVARAFDCDEDRVLEVEEALSELRMHGVDRVLAEWESEDAPSEASRPSRPGNLSLLWRILLRVQGYLGGSVREVCVEPLPTAVRLAAVGVEGAAAELATRRPEQADFAARSAAFASAVGEASGSLAEDTGGTQILALLFVLMERLGEEILDSREDLPETPDPRADPDLSFREDSFENSFEDSGESGTVGREAPNVPEDANSILALHELRRASRSEFLVESLAWSVPLDKLQLCLESEDPSVAFRTVEALLLGHGVECLPQVLPVLLRSPSRGVKVLEKAMSVLRDAALEPACALFREYPSSETAGFLRGTASRLATERARVVLGVYLPSLTHQLPLEVLSETVLDLGTKPMAEDFLEGIADAAEESGDRVEEDLLELVTAIGRNFGLEEVAKRAIEDLEAIKPPRGLGCGDGIDDEDALGLDGDGEDEGEEDDGGEESVEFDSEDLALGLEVETRSEPLSRGLGRGRKPCGVGDDDDDDDDDDTEDGDTEDVFSSFEGDTPYDGEASEEAGITFDEEEETPGPLDPCPCGSGKKYKNCCGR